MTQNEVEVDDYRIVLAESVEELERKVRRLLRRGWRLQGGVAITPHGVNSAWHTFFQAMSLPESDRHSISLR